MDNRELLTEYLTRATDLLTQAETLELQAHDLRIRRETLLEAADLLRPLVNEDPEDLSDVVADFTRCANNVERIVRIARVAPHKLLNTTKVAQYLLNHGQSKGKFENLRTEVDRALAGNPKYFEKVSKGTYRYVGESQETVDETTPAPIDATVVPVGVETPGVDATG